MVDGLKEFRNYLDLIQIGDEIDRSHCDCLIIDTPPFQEALGLLKAIKHLQRFFETSLITWALRMNHNAMVQGAIKRVFDMLRFFSGKAAASQLYDFITWLSEHSERFSRSAAALQKLLSYSEKVAECILVHERSVEFLDNFKE